ncbi:MAG: Lrp/AsnC family transcriptional regulator [Nanoarchaeota archaeon]|nr:Lrp/AsnC family transcriptional regulator [Nanoarchaeota archaeon]MBU1850066.1 Lrp/AsnC family transcriptional regulator [Nanoarchaeota archaeon]
MQKKDLLFLTHLRQNARETLTRISKRTDIPISTLYDKLKTLEKSLITKHTTLIDFTKLGYLCRANITIKVNITDREEVKKYLQCQENVNSLFKINNGYDYLIDAVFKHVKELEDFLEKLEQKFPVNEKQVYYIIEDIKREAFLSDPEIVNMLLKENNQMNIIDPIIL